MPREIGLDPSMGALRISAMLARGEALPEPPEIVTERCPACGAVGGAS